MAAEAQPQDKSMRELHGKHKPKAWIGQSYIGSIAPRQTHSTSVVEGRVLAKIAFPHFTRPALSMNLYSQCYRDGQFYYQRNKERCNDLAPDISEGVERAAVISRKPTKKDNSLRRFPQKDRLVLANGSQLQAHGSILMEWTKYENYMHHKEQ